MLEFILSKLRSYWENIVGIVPELIVGLIVLAVFYFLSKFVSLILKNRLEKRLSDKLLVQFICNITRIAIILIGVLFFIKTIGLTSFLSGFIGGAAISAIIIGFAFKDIIENFLAGIILAFNRPFKEGDTIVSGDITGDVVDLSIRYTHLKSFEGFDIYIPNGMMIMKPLINYTRDGMRRFDFLVNIDYSSDLVKAASIIRNVVDNAEEVLKTPAPLIIMDSFQADYAVLKVLYWINNDLLSRSQFLVKSDLMMNITSELLKNKINMPLSSIEIQGTGKPVDVNLIKES